jgi:hypothetical protein
MRTGRIFIILSGFTLVFFASCGVSGGQTAVTGGAGFQPGGSKVLILKASYQINNDYAQSPYQTIPVLNEVSASCLACHGPAYEDLMKKTADFVDANGDKVQPHAYLDMTRANPHDTTAAIDCLLCHTAHALPAPAGPVPASLDYCYNCHHTKDLISCTFCHPG